MAKKWRNDPAFVDWLLSEEYAREEDGKLHTVMSEGTYLYMWQAWQASEEYLVLANIADPELIEEMKRDRVLG